MAWWAAGTSHHYEGSALRAMVHVKKNRTYYYESAALVLLPINTIRYPVEYTVQQRDTKWLTIVAAMQTCCFLLPHAKFKTIIYRRCVFISLDVFTCVARSTNNQSFDSRFELPLLTSIIHIRDLRFKHAQMHRPISHLPPPHALVCSLDAGRDYS